jgi:hypothetical protein
MAGRKVIKSELLWKHREKRSLIFSGSVSGVRLSGFYPGNFNFSNPNTSIEKKYNINGGITKTGRWIE